MCEHLGISALTGKRVKGDDDSAIKFATNVYRKKISNQCSIDVISTFSGVYTNFKTKSVLI